MLICGHMRLVFIFPLGDVTSIAFFMGRVMRLCLATKWALMKECDAPVSNKNVVGCELTRNILSTNPAPPLLSPPLHGSPSRPAVVAFALGLYYGPIVASHSIFDTKGRH